MAIFSSKNKHKKGEGSGSTSAANHSPPIGNHGGGVFPRSGSSQQSGLSGSIDPSGGVGMMAAASSGAGPGGPGGVASSIPVLSSSQQGYSHSPLPPPSSSSAFTAPPSAPSSSSSAVPSAAPPSHTVLYPWSQRRITLQPSQLLAPPSSSHPASPSPPILGPVSPPPFPRYGHSVNPLASSPSGDLYIFGGLVANSVKNDLYLLSCASPQLGAGPSSLLSVSLIETRGEVPGPRVGHASVGVGNVLIVWGGDTKSRPEERQDDGLYLLNLSTREWTRVKTIGPAPEGRYGHAAAMVGSKFFIFGGQTDDSSPPAIGPGGQPVVGGFKNDLGWFDLQKLKLGQPRWSFVEYAPGAVVPPPRTGHTCVTYGDALYIFGGTDGQYHYNDTWCFDLQTSTWTELSCIGYIPVPREGHAATLVDDVMYVFGGRGVDGKDLEDLAAFKIGNQRWFMFQNMGPAPSGRSGHAMATWQNKVLVLGGESYTSQRADDPGAVHVLDTTKIKYPPDATRQPPSAPSSAAIGAGPPVSRKSSIPVIAGLPGASSGSPSPSSPTPDELRQRAASPTGSQRGLKSSTSSSVVNGGGVAPGAAASIGQLMTNGGSSAGGSSKSSPVVGPGTSKIAKRATTGAPPVRPARPGDEDFGAPSAGAAAAAGGTGGDRRTMDPGSMERGMGGGIGTAVERAMSPTGASAQGSRIGGLRKASGGRGPEPQAVRAISPVQQQVATPPMASMAAFVSPSQHQPQQQHQQQEQVDLAGSTSSLPPPVATPAQAPAPSDAFYYGGAPPPRAGPPPPAQHQPSQLNGDRSASPAPIPAPVSAPISAPAPTPAPVVDNAALLAKDEEIARLKAQQGWMVAALGVASKKGFVPSEGDGMEKLAKVEREQGVEGGKEREMVEMLLVMKGELAKAKSLMADQAASVDDRLQSANRSRSAALQEAAYYRAKLAALESGSVNDLSKLDRERASDLEKKLAEALASRSALEGRVARLEQDLEHQSTMRTSSEERHIAATTRAEAAEQSHTKALADFSELQKRSQSHESTIADHVAQIAALTSSSKVLNAENEQLKTRSTEHEMSLAQHVRTLEETQVALAAANVRNDELLATWEKAASDLTEQQLRVAQLQQELEAAKVENAAALNKAADLERLLKSTKDAHDAMQVLAAGGLAEVLAAHKERALRDPGSSSRDVQGVDSDRLRAFEEEMSTVKQLHVDARTKGDSLASELADARAREVELHAQVSTLRSELAVLQTQHLTAMEDLGRHRSLVVEREASARDAARSREAVEVKAGLLRSLLADHGLAVSDEELAARFPPMTGSESPEQLYRRVQELEGRLEQRTKQHADLEAAHQEARRELQEAEQRHRDVEGEVQRLRNAEPVGIPEDKERLGKVEGELEALQARHQQLEATHLKAVQYVKGTEKMLRRMKEELTRYKERCEELESPERQAEFDSLRQQVQDLRSSADASSRQAEELQRTMASLQADYQRTLREQQAEAAAKVKELNVKLEQAHHDLEETHGVNASLNQELQTALKNPSSPRIGSHGGSEDLNRLQAELEQAQNKAEWLKRENASLEQRCRTAESKIAILLDHMEGVGEQYDGGSGPHDQQSYEHGWQSTGNHHLEHDSMSDAGSEYSEHQRR
ncbi:SPOSA6832_02191 [Sporobolomyces salmonicolor]|uniref:SPOSA6832_02191-mRNA-1:cds n=1 Tax=Sporidiobolus salmonicolor TaxID=5005 RepID=A0A0D6EKX6_SPOSA|nr:SPOSA6832_02191 [Sporobolomyces salmonicolor]